MKVEDIWENVFNYSNYVKGAKYSASDIIGDILSVRLRRDNPNHNKMDYKDKISAFIGSSIHTQAEAWLTKENAFDETGWESEVKLNHNNISGTADVIIDGTIVLDFKTGKESSIRTNILNVEKKRESSWQKQISIYSLLNHKQNKKPYPTIGYIAWLCVDTQKHGLLEVELLLKEETIQLIKDFLVAIEQPIEEMNQCNLCVQFKNRWCGVRDICPKWGEDKEWQNKIEEW